MTLPEINLGPLPTDEDLQPFLGKAATPDIVRMLAEIEWRMDLQSRNPDAFLIAFSRDAFPALGFHTYADYLASTLWDRIKRQELRKAGGTCAACEKRTRTIHHRDYRPRVLRGEDRSALIALCQACHDRVHYGARRQERSWNESERVLRELIERGGL